jgi:hypothetical protein
MYATLRNILEPVRGDVGRRQPRLCLATLRKPFGVGSCDEGHQHSFGYDISSGCTGRRASLIFGVAGPGIRVEARTGDGRWRPVRMLAPPAGYAPAGERAWVCAIPTDVAVRAIRGRAADGRVLDVTPLGMAPPRLSCDTGEPLGFFLSDAETPPALTGPETVLTPPGGPPLRVDDADAELCVTLGPAPRDRTCDLPSPGAAGFVIAVSPDGLSIGGAVDPAVAAVEARTVNGRRVRVATDPGAAYTGRYARPPCLRGSPTARRSAGGCSTRPSGGRSWSPRRRPAASGESRCSTGRARRWPPTSPVSRRRGASAATASGSNGPTRAAHGQLGRCGQPYRPV